MRTLVIGDTHFHNTNRELRLCQIQCIRDLLQGVACDNVVFLGDVFDKRSPSPECILDVRNLFQGVKKNVFILRGNHDSASKADDGVTILSYWSVMLSSAAAALSHYETCCHRQLSFHSTL